MILYCLSITSCLVGSWATPGSNDWRDPATWGSTEDFRWAGPHTTAFPCDVIWKLGSEEMRFAEMTVKKMTQLRNFARMKASPAPKAWRRRLGTSVGGMFRIKCFYTTPRDEVTWMKVWHRNLCGWPTETLRYRTRNAMRSTGGVAGQTSRCSTWPHAILSGGSSGTESVG